MAMGLIMATELAMAMGLVMAMGLFMAMGLVTATGLGTAMGVGMALAMATAERCWLKTSSKGGTEPKQELRFEEEVLLGRPVFYPAGQNFSFQPKMLILI